MKPVTRTPARRLALNTALAALVLVTGCSPGASGAGTKAADAARSAAVHPVSGLEIVPVTVLSGKIRHAFRAEVARSPQAQARGLMFRTQMGDDEGMIFPRNPPDRAAFWMRNTVIPLDIIFIGLDGRIMNIAANAVPYDETPLPAAGPTLAVFEINGGLAARLGIKPGDKVEW